MRNYDQYFEGYNVPESIKTRAIAIMKRFNIWGICDGMYIANSIAYWSGSGDGQGNFNTKPNEFTRLMAMKISSDLGNSYGCNIDVADRQVVRNIVMSGKLDIQESLRGLTLMTKRLTREFIDAVNENNKWRSEYLQSCIASINDTVLEMEKEALV